MLTITDKGGRGGPDPPKYGWQKLWRVPYSRMHNKFKQRKCWPVSFGILGIWFLPTQLGSTTFQNHGGGYHKPDKWTYKHTKNIFSNIEYISEHRKKAIFFLLHIFKDSTSKKLNWIKNIYIISYSKDCPLSGL